MHRIAEPFNSEEDCMQTVRRTLAVFLALWLVAPQVHAPPDERNHREEREPRQQHAHLDEKHGAEPGHREPHEEVGAAPHRGERDEAREVRRPQGRARSSARRRALRSSPPAYPVSSPPLPTMRWQGTTIVKGLRPVAAPAARAAPFAPARAASSA